MSRRAAVFDTQPAVALEGNDNTSNEVGLKPHSRLSDGLQAKATTPPLSQNDSTSGTRRPDVEPGDETSLQRVPNE
jgi:hypothetical protein